MASPEESILKRVLPHSVEAEQSVIGSMIMDRDAILTASEIITGDDFYNKQYGVIYDTMVELYNAGKPVDLITLQNALKEKELPPESSSPEFIRDIVSAVPTSANIKYYANIVAEKSTFRRLIKVNEEIANTCYAGKEPLEVVLNDTEKKVFDLVQKQNHGDFVPIKQVVMDAMDKIEIAAKNGGAVTGIPTGFIDLDYRMAGLHPADLILIAARPSMGKTAFVLNIAQHIAFKQNLPVAIFSLEMSKVQLVNRLFALESSVDSQHIRTGQLSAVTVIMNDLLVQYAVGYDDIETVKAVDHGMTDRHITYGAADAARLKFDPVSQLERPADADHYTCDHVAERGLCCKTDNCHHQSCGSQKHPSNGLSDTEENTGQQYAVDQENKIKQALGKFFQKFVLSEKAMEQLMVEPDQKYCDQQRQGHSQDHSNHCCNMRFQEEAALQKIRDR